MKNAKLVQLLAMVIASSTLGARGLACIGNCQEYSQRIVMPTLPANSGGDAGVIPSESTETLCARHCSNSDSCRATTIAQPDGTTIPALECGSVHECLAGRRPAGLANIGRDERSTEAQWLSHAAYLEAASIDAFRLVRRDLRALGAPRCLLRQASRAAREEKRHARRMRALAKRSGITVRAPIVKATPIPSLEQMALQNAVEGCIRETFGALVARYQALHADDREIAAAMKRIAVDEAHHAALAYRIDEWAQRRLGSEARGRIATSRLAAAREMLNDVAMAVDFRGQKPLGLPNACTALELARGLFEFVRIIPDKPSTN